MIEFGRESCSRLEVTENQEWLVTNGMGGFAMGTVAGILSRRYHGLLVAALKPPVGRTLLLAKLDEDVKYQGNYIQLFCNRWADGSVEQEGLSYLERFHLDGTIPVWTYAYADAILEKRVWLAQGENTTYIHYYFRRGSSPLEIYAKALVNYRDYHATTIMNEWPIHLEDRENGLEITLFEGAEPFYLLTGQGKVWREKGWYEDFFLAEEDYRGQRDPVEDHVHVGVLGTTLRPGESFTIIASTNPQPTLDGQSAYQARRQYERNLIAQAGTVTPAPLPQLVLAADQFIVERETPAIPAGRSIIAGYPWFSDWGRDTMIALLGLTLCTGRAEIANKILRTFANFVDQGMLPNRFPDEGDAPEYNTVDATLWYFNAIYAYYQATGDEKLVQDLFPVLADIISWHVRGTRYNIQRDPIDGLLYAGEEGIQLTWMDAKVDDWVVTPRIGKPVEINALWYNALCIMTEFAGLIGEDRSQYETLAEKAKEGFAKFWGGELGYCYDVVDDPAGDDPSLRPNQLFAISLPHSPLNPKQKKAIVDTCAQHLYTPHGLRSLAPTHADYIGQYGGDRYKRDGTYHQGTTWGWLMGAFVIAHLKVYGDKDLARSYLQPLVRHLKGHGIGSLSEIFDGDPPFTPRGCPAQAWTVAELLRAWQATTQ